MFPFSTLSIISSSILLVLLFYVMFYHPRSRQLFIFILLTLSTLILSVSSIFLYVAKDPEAAWFWNRFTASSWVLIIGLGMLLVIYLYHDNESSPRYLILMIVVPSLFFLYRGVTDGTMASEYLPGPYGYYPVYPLNSPWLYLYILYCIQFIVFNYYYLIRKYRNSKKQRIRTQALIYMAAVSVPVLFASFFEILFPLFRLTRLPPLGHFFLLPYLVIVLFSITRYRLMMINVPFTADIILKNINNLVALFDEKGNFVSMNESGLDILGYDDTCSEQCCFYSLFLGREKVWDMIDKNSKDSHSVINQVLYLRGCSGIAVPMNVSIKIIFDEFGDHIGYIVTGSRLDMLDNAMKRFGITEREKTILMLLLQGLEYADIAEKLYISQLTVKTHIHNIYEKTGAKNRSQLIRICFIH